MTDDIPVPPRLQGNARDARGFLVPYAQFVGRDGTPDFRIVDAERVALCLRRRLCGMCGGAMDRHVWFVGGPLCVTNGLFCDPPMHKDCAVYALRACAHLNRSKGRFSRAPRPPAGDGVRIAEQALASDEKSDWFALMRTTRYEAVKSADGMTLIKAKLPWIEVERWRDGAPMETQ